MFRRRGHVVKLAFVVLLALPAYVLLLGKAPKSGLIEGEPGFLGGGGKVNAGPESLRNRGDHSHIPAPPYSNDNPHNFDPKDLQQQRRRSLQDRDGQDQSKVAGVSQAQQPFIEVSGVRGN